MLSVEGRRLVIIVLLVGLVLAISGCTTLTRTDLTSPATGDVFTKSFEWKHKGRTYTWDIPIPRDLYEHYRDLPRNRDYEEYVTDLRDDEYLGSLCEKLEQTEVKSDWSGKIDFVLSFVQSLKYTDDEAIGFDEYPRFPVETLVDEGGDCEDTSILFVSIVRELGYGVVLLRLDEAQHMSAGIRISGEVITGWDKSYPLTYYQSNGKFYAYCETTGSGWRIGEKPDWVGSEGAVVLHV
jgi:hypothetical protein